MTRKPYCGEDKREAALGIGDIDSDAVDHCVSAGNEGLFHEPKARVVKNPHAVMLVRRDHIYCIHEATSNPVTPAGRASRRDANYAGSIGSRAASHKRDENEKRGATSPGANAKRITVDVRFASLADILTQVRTMSALLP